MKVWLQSSMDRCHDAEENRQNHKTLKLILTELGFGFVLLTFRSFHREMT